MNNPQSPIQQALAKLHELRAIVKQNKEAKKNAS